jgi:HPt (histidine-containing phosphotransfer) domain-containing protein
VQAIDDALFTPESPVNPAVLREIAGDDTKLAHNLLNDFLAAARKDHAALVAALDAANVPEAIRQAHRIKGAAALVGARDVHAAATAAEAAGRAGGGVALDTATDALSAALDLLAVWVER